MKSLFTPTVSKLSCSLNISYLLFILDCLLEVDLELMLSIESWDPVFLNLIVGLSDLNYLYYLLSP